MSSRLLHCDSWERQLKGGLLWLTVSEHSVLLGGQERRSHHGNQEVEKRENIGDHITSKETLTHVYFLQLDPFPQVPTTCHTAPLSGPRTPLEESVGRDARTHKISKLGYHLMWGDHLKKSLQLSLLCQQTPGCQTLHQPLMISNGTGSCRALSMCSRFPHSSG